MPVFLLLIKNESYERFGLLGECQKSLTENPPNDESMGNVFHRCWAPWQLLCLFCCLTVFPQTREARMLRIAD